MRIYKLYLLSYLANTNEKVKKVFAGILFVSFLVSSILMPFYNFEDTSSTRMLYFQFLQQDDDGNVFEFIANDILNMSSLFEDEDEPRAPLSQSQDHSPFPTIQITPGFLFCTHSVQEEKEEQFTIPHVYSVFVSNKYKLDFSSFVFHPPAFIS